MKKILDTQQISVKLMLLLVYLLIYSLHIAIPKLWIIAAGLFTERQIAFGYATIRAKIVGKMYDTKKWLLQGDLNEG